MSAPENDSKTKPKSGGSTTSDAKDRRALLRAALAKLPDAEVVPQEEEPGYLSNVDGDRATEEDIAEDEGA